MSEKSKDYITGQACGSVLSVQAMDGEGKDKLPTINIQAYNGDEIRQWWGRTVVDLEGVEVADTVAILANHNPETPVGHASASAIKISESGGIELTGGVLSGDPDDPDTRRILRMAENGFPWQASIGAPILRRENIEAGATVKVNGRDFEGPISVVRASKLKEITVLTMGADETTSTQIAAEENFHQPQIKGESMGLEENRDSIESPNKETVKAVDHTAELDALKAELAETQRVSSIKEIAVDHPELKAKAIDGGWTADQVSASVAEIEKIRAERPEPKFNIGTGAKAEGSIEAGFAKSCGVSDEIIASDLGADAVSDAPKVESFSQLAQLKLSEAGQFNPTLNKEEMLRLAFSTVGLPNILSNTANKILLGAFNSAPAVSSQLAVERMVSDFKEISMMDLTMDLTLKKIGETGEADHATVSDDVQTGKVDSYARQFVVDRKMLINDDLGAFQRIFAGYGKGAMVAEERNFFSVFTSATCGTENADNALSIDGLTQAFTDLGNQVDENGDPIDISGALLVVPTALATFARQLQSSMYVDQFGATTDGAKPTANPHAGQFEVVVAPYLNNANVSGGAADRWYLMANPNAIPSFAKMHLIGAMTPVIRQQALSVGSFGVGTDAVYDFGATAVGFKNEGIVKNEVA